MKNILKLEYIIISDNEWTEDEQDIIDDALIDASEKLRGKVLGKSLICTRQECLSIMECLMEGIKQRVEEPEEDEA